LKKCGRRQPFDLESVTARHQHHLPRSAHQTGCCLGSRTRPSPRGADHRTHDQRCLVNRPGASSELSALTSTPWSIASARAQRRVSFLRRGRATPVCRQQRSCQRHAAADDGRESQEAGSTGNQRHDDAGSDHDVDDNCQDGGRSQWTDGCVHECQAVDPFRGAGQPGAQPPAVSPLLLVSGAPVAPGVEPDRDRHEHAQVGRDEFRAKPTVLLGKCGGPHQGCVQRGGSDRNPNTAAADGATASSTAGSRRSSNGASSRERVASASPARRQPTLPMAQR